MAIGFCNTNAGFSLVELGSRKRSFVQHGLRSLSVSALAISCSPTSTCRGASWGIIKGYRRVSSNLKHFNRKQLLTYTVNLPVCVIGIEACAGAHFLARAPMMRFVPIKNEAQLAV